MIEQCEYHSCTVYLKDGEPHRPNGPARIYRDGSKYWWLYGIRHRYYGPQCKDIYGTIWRIHGVLIKHERHEQNR